MSMQIENIKLLRKIAWKYYKSTGHDMDDLLQEAYLGYRYALETHNLERGKFTTYVWYCVSSHLSHYLSKERRDLGRIQQVDYEAEEVFNTHQNPTPFWERIPIETHEIAELILANPDRYLNRSLQEVTTDISVQLIENGWNEYKIRRIIKTLIKYYNND